MGKQIDDLLRGLEEDLEAFEEAFDTLPELADEEGHDSDLPSEDVRQPDQQEKPYAEQIAEGHEKYRTDFLPALNAASERVEEEFQGIIRIYQ